MDNPSLIVVGLGNPLMADEGIGIYLLHRLRERCAGDGMEYYDLGTGGLRLLHIIADCRKAILIDCARMGESPGTLRRFTPDEVRSRKSLPGFSLHEGDLLSTLALSRFLGEAPGDLVIFGIQPALVTPDPHLSPILITRLPEYEDAIAAEIRQWPQVLTSSTRASA